MDAGQHSSAGAVRAYIQLLRPANMITATADVLAGYAAAGSVGLEHLGWLLFSTLALYAGGVVFNDYFDRELDSLERPERPIPSGRASARSAALFASVLLAMGIAAGFQASLLGGVIAGLIATAAIVYNRWAKHIGWAGPVLMGTCRALNLLLGVSANPGMLASRWFIALVPLVYISAITLLSPGEVHGGSRLRALLATGMCAIAAAGVAAIGFTPDFRAVNVLFPLALLCCWLGPPLWRACRWPEAAQIRSAVRAGVLSLVILDSAIAAGYAGLLYATGLVVLVVLASSLARLFPVT